MISINFSLFSPRTLAALVWLVLPLPVVAAPLDALLTAAPARSFIEIAHDEMNSTLDVLNLRGQDAQYSGTTVGDYRGTNVRAGLALGPYFSADGAYWQRKLFYRNDVAEMNSWKVGGQVLLWGANDPAALKLAVRASQWHNGANVLSKSSATKIAGQTLQNLRLENPEDSQRQYDVIVSWPVTENWLLSAFAGTTDSRVSVRGLSAEMITSGQCRYALSFGDTGMGGQLISACTTPYAPIVFGISGPDYAILPQLQYTARSEQLGGSLQWSSRNWQLKVGYQFQHLTRDKVDDLIVSKKGSIYRDNHIVVGELDYRLHGSWWLLLRGQAMSNQFVGEIPFTYNVFTASKFNRPYGFASAGVKWDF